MRKIVFIIVCLFAVLNVAFMCYEGCMRAYGLYTGICDISIYRVIVWWLATLGWGYIAYSVITRKYEWTKKI